MATGEIMRFYGLHWTSDGGCPLQVRIDTRTLEVWARSCPRGGEWTPWRRLDVYRNADGTLNETVYNCETANRLANPVTINLSGAVTGYAQFDGSGDVNIVTAKGSGDGDTGGSDTGDIETRLARVEELLGYYGHTIQRILRDGIISGEWASWWEIAPEHIPPEYQ